MKTADPVLKRFGLTTKSQKMKYERFVQEYMISCNAVTAFEKVSPDTNTKSSNKQGAYLLVRHPYVVYLLNKKNKELDKIMDEKIIMNRERILQELEEILIKTKSSETYNLSLKALDQLARVTGAYAPEKTEVEHKGITINYIKPLESYNDDIENTQTSIED
tara:strand:+ start:1878 stop:2363 length:486 start_codon:yes stop_codon:yes gene_type:complete